MKTYSEEEINSLIEELQKELPGILKAEAEANKDDLTKAEGKLVAGGGSGGEHLKGMKKEEAAPYAPPAAGGKEDKKADYVKETAVSGDGKGKYWQETSLGKEESSAASSSDKSESSEKSKVAKDEDPLAASPAEEASKPAAPEAAENPAEPAAEEAPQDEQSLEQAYGQLSDEDLKAHYDALKGVLMQRMQAQQGADQAAPPAPAPAPAAPPSPSPAPAAPVNKGVISTGMALAEKSMELSKAADEKVVALETQLASVTKLLEMMLTQPAQKAVTTMAEYVAKSELEKPAPKKYTKVEAVAQLSKAARDPSLKRLDRDSIDRYVLVGDNFKDIEHLLK